MELRRSIGARSRLGVLELVRQRPRELSITLSINWP